jgi:hypothetical protein
MNSGLEIRDWSHTDGDKVGWSDVVRGNVSELLARFSIDDRDEDTSRWPEIQDMLGTMRKQGLSQTAYLRLCMYLYFPLDEIHDRPRILLIKAWRSQEEDHELAAWLAYPQPEDNVLRARFLAPGGSLTREEAMSLS